eukprot:3444581-Pleurochrysis_carterae.AAC.1
MPTPFISPSRRLCGVGSAAKHGNVACSIVLHTEKYWKSIKISWENEQDRAESNWHVRCMYSKRRTTR